MELSEYTELGLFVLDRSEVGKSDGGSFHFFHVLRATGGVGSDAALNGVENTPSSNAGK